MWFKLKVIAVQIADWCGWLAYAADVLNNKEDFLKTAKESPNDNPTPPPAS